MGLLDKWKKKKKQDQLEAVEKKSTEVEVEKEKKTGSKSKIKTEKKEAKKDSSKLSSKPKPKKAIAKKTGKACGILLNPVVSEKAGTMETQGKYTFVVNKNATKGQIKQVVKDLYGVVPVSVRTAQYEGKRVRFGYTRGKRKDWKKAIIELPKGHTIHIHEGV